MLLWKSPSSLDVNDGAPSYDVDEPAWISTCQRALELSGKALLIPKLDSDGEV